MLQLVCEIFLALVVVFLIYLAFKKIFTVTYHKDKIKDVEKKSDNSGDSKDITKH